MLTLAIGGFALIMILANAGSGSWGVVALVAVVVIGLMCAAGAERKENRAYVNRRDYWASGGPEQYRRKQSRR